MVFITQPTEEGEKMECPNCGQELISRLKDYKDFPSKIQWQDKYQTKAHFDRNGNCKEVETTQSKPNLSKEESSPQEKLETATQNEMIARIFDMTKEMYHDFTDRKTNS